MKRFLIIIIGLLVFCTNAMPQNIYVVAVGVSNYQYANSLVLPAQDAKDVVAFYRQKTNNVITITSKYATKATIIKCLKDQFSRATINDMVVFYFSGHGYKGGLCPYEAKSGSPNSMLPYSEIQEIFRNCKARRKIVFADACHSGGLKGTYSTISRNDFEILLFLACREEEYSEEHEEYMKNGIFTTFLLRGLRGNADANGYGNGDGKVTAKELFNYVSKNVIFSSIDRQHPVMRGRFDDNMILN